MLWVIDISLDYVTWHYTRGVRDLFTMWRNLLWFIGRFFSIGLLFLSLLSPWRAMAEEREPGSGFSFSEAASRIVVNTLMRVVGFIIRLVFIVFGAAFWLVLLIAGAPLFIFWFVLPPLAVGCFFAGLALMFV